MWTKKKEGQMIIDESSYLIDDEKDNMESLTYKLAKNYAQLTQLISERKNLLIAITQLHSKQNQEKVFSIEKAKSKDLKNQLKLLRDPTFRNLIENADRIDGPKVLLKRVISMDVSRFEDQQKNKGLKFWDNLKVRTNSIKSTLRKCQQFKQGLDKICEIQRAKFRQIEQYQLLIKQTLVKKQKDFLAKADELNEEVEKVKIFLKKNKQSRDKKKQELIQEIKSLFAKIKDNQEESRARYRQIQDLYTGIDTLESFDSFIEDFQTILSNKVDSKVIPNNSSPFKELISDYQGILQQIQQLKQTQATILMNMQQNYQKKIRIIILQKAYLNDISSDRKELTNLISKCQQYRKLMGILLEQKTNIDMEVSKKNQMGPFSSNLLKNYENQDKIRFQLKKQLEKMLKNVNQLQESEKSIRNFKFQMSNLELKRKNILTELESSAAKGNVKEYKANDIQLQDIDKEIKILIDSTNGQKISQLDNKLRIQTHTLKEKYRDIINQIINEETTMSYLEFLIKLYNRLSLV